MRTLPKLQAKIHVYDPSNFLWSFLIANNVTFHEMTARSQMHGFYGGGVPNLYRQPAAAGTSVIISCQAVFLKGNEDLQFRQGFKHLSWSLRFPNGSFTFLGGINSTGFVSIHSDPQKYAIDRKIGFLTINKVTRADETEYKCAIKDETNLYSEPDESFVKLDVIENPGNVIDNLLHNAILIST